MGFVPTLSSVVSYSICDSESAWVFLSIYAHNYINPNIFINSVIILLFLLCFNSMISYFYFCLISIFIKVVDKVVNIIIIININFQSKLYH